MLNPKFLLALLTVVAGAAFASCKEKEVPEENAVELPVEKGVAPPVFDRDSIGNHADSIPKATAQEVGLKED
ncbi:MAG: hypothetical protein J1E97_08045 [Muribaculaceae bacterium]|nr:hypothetical protein [Muribaculaceae bacterium]